MFRSSRLTPLVLWQACYQETKGRNRSINCSVLTVRTQLPRWRRIHVQYGELAGFACGTSQWTPRFGKGERPPSLSLCLIQYSSLASQEVLDQDWAAICVPSSCACSVDTSRSSTGGGLPPETAAEHTLEGTRRRVAACSFMLVPRTSGPRSEETPTLQLRRVWSLEVST